MIFEKIRAGEAVDDREFNAIYPAAIRSLAGIHFTPLAVAKLAARYLAVLPGMKVLDIGSGAGKFCMIGSVWTEGHFTGVEQRVKLHSLARRISKRHGLTRVNFIHANITDIDFAAFDAFYLFNPFYENIDRTGPIDDSVELKRHLYFQYSSYVKRGLEKMPAGTRLVTYFSYKEEIPPAFELQLEGLEGKLKMWKKTE